MRCIFGDDTILMCVLFVSAFVGVVAIAISIPIPMYLSKYVTVYQKEKMSLVCPAKVKRNPYSSLIKV